MKNFKVELLGFIGMFLSIKLSLEILFQKSNIQVILNKNESKHEIKSIKNIEKDSKKLRKSFRLVINFYFIL